MDISSKGFSFQILTYSVDDYTAVDYILPCYVRCKSPGAMCVEAYLKLAYMRDRRQTHVYSYFSFLTEVYHPHLFLKSSGGRMRSITDDQLFHLFLL